MKHSKYSCIIIGSGISGLYSALKISETINLNDDILIVTKSNLSNCNSNYAQGGIVGVLESNKNDSVELHVLDTLKAGGGLCEFECVKFISENSSNIIDNLIETGVKFDRDENNNIKLTLEGAHSVNRVLHINGDATGHEIEKTLINKVKNTKNITILEQTMAVELLINADNVCKGIIAYNCEFQEYETIYASCVILATGGLGQLYKYTTNPSVATGDGIALAYRANALIQDLEFIQFHPTALLVKNENKMFLISESVRGEGAKLVDVDGNAFMHKYDDRLELAPRDIVSRAIYNEMQETKYSCMYLDATGFESSKFEKRFPTIFNKCIENGIDPENNYIPVSPGAHYSMGGIKTNIEGQTSIKNLYAVGEVASNGLHGANRLASNSLLECVICAAELANYLSFTNLSSNCLIDDCVLETIKKYQSNDIFEEDINIENLKAELKNIMWNCVGILRDERSLLLAKKKLENLKSKFKLKDKCFSKSQYEFRNMIIVSQIIVENALNREESRGAHYRIDYPQTNEIGKHSVIMKDGKKYDGLSVA